MARLMALCSLPRTNPGNRLQYVRVNGPYTLIMFSSGKTKLPFGNGASSVAGLGVHGSGATKSRKIVLGSSLSEFMREIGLDNSSGAYRSTGIYTSCGRITW